MQIRFTNSPAETKQMDTEQLRENFLVSNLMKDDELQLVYSHYDRVIIGGAKPVNKTLELANHPELRAEYFLERRELGVINVGGKGKVTTDDQTLELDKLDCVYVGRGTKKVSFSSANKNSPAIFYLLSAPAHQNYPTG